MNSTDIATFLLKKHARLPSTSSTITNLSQERSVGWAAQILTARKVILQEDIYASAIPTALPTLGWTFQYDSHAMVIHKYVYGTTTELGPISTATSNATLITTHGLTDELWTALKNITVKKVHSMGTLGSVVVKVEGLQLTSLDSMASSPSFFHPGAVDAVPFSSTGFLYLGLIETSDQTSSFNSSGVGNWLLQEDCGILQFFDVNATAYTSGGSLLNLFPVAGGTSSTWFSSTAGPRLTFWKYVGSKGVGFGASNTNTTAISYDSGTTTTSVAGALSVSGATTIGGGLTVSGGNTLFNGTASFGSTVNTYANTYLGSTDSAVVSNGGFFANSYSRFTGIASFDNIVNMNGHVNLGDASTDIITSIGAFTASNAATFDGTVTMNGDVSLGDASTDTITSKGAFTATNSATFNGVTNFNGITNFANTVNMNGNVNLGDTSTDTISLSGQTNVLGGLLGATATATFSHNATWAKWVWFNVGTFTQRFSGRIHFSAVGVGLGDSICINMNYCLSQGAASASNIVIDHAGPYTSGATITRVAVDNLEVYNATHTVYVLLVLVGTVDGTAYVSAITDTGTPSTLNGSSVFAATCIPSLNYPGSSTVVNLGSTGVRTIAGGLNVGGALTVSGGAVGRRMVSTRLPATTGTWVRVARTNSVLGEIKLGVGVNTHSSVYLRCATTIDNYGTLQVTVDKEYAGRMISQVAACGFNAFRYFYVYVICSTDYDLNVWTDFQAPGDTSKGGSQAGFFLDSPAIVQTYTTEVQSSGCIVATVEPNTFYVSTGIQIGTRYVPTVASSNQVIRYGSAAIGAATSGTISFGTTFSQVAVVTVSVDDNTVGSAITRLITTTGFSYITSNAGTSSRSLKWIAIGTAVYDSGAKSYN